MKHAIRPRPIPPWLMLVIAIVTAAEGTRAQEPAQVARTQRGERTALDRYVAAPDPS